MSVGTSIRYKHRCCIAIALYKKYHRRGIGRQMLNTILDVAKKNGYTQAELEVVTELVSKSPVLPNMLKTGAFRL